jgi:protein-S-isoprenylcysteine O-methyltransferase Ste14
LARILVLWGIVATGGLSLAVFAVFLLAGTYIESPSRTGLMEALLWDGLLCGLFFVQHSLMVRRGFRSQLARWIAPAFHGLLYTACASAALVALVGLWLPTGVVLFDVTGPVKWLVWAAFGLSGAGMLWVMPKGAAGALLGYHAAVAHLRSRADSPIPLFTEGAYRWVRHPLYLLTLAMLWASPRLTADRLVLDVLFTLWVVLGIRWEERDLLHGYGEAYAQYRRQVPMLLPWRCPSTARVPRGVRPRTR